MHGIPRSTSQGDRLLGEQPKVQEVARAHDLVAPDPRDLLEGILEHMKVRVDVGQNGESVGHVSGSNQ